MNKKNILFVIHYPDINSGATRSLADVIDTLIERELIQATILFCGNPGNAVNYFETKGIHCYRHKYGRLDYDKGSNLIDKMCICLKIMIKYLIDRCTLNRLATIIEKEKIEIIYSNTSVVYIGDLLAKKFALPHIWHIREFCQEDHNLGLCFGNKSFIRRVNRANAVLFISNSIQKKYKSKITTRQYVIYNDISPLFIKARAFDKSTISDCLHVAIIGTIQEGKRQIDAIKAIEIANGERIRFILHIAGSTSGKYYEKIHDYVDKHNLNDMVFFDGFVKDTVTYRQNMDIGIVASYLEGFGRVTIEGMLNGMLMIGSDSAGTSELIINGKNGLLYPMGDIDALAESLSYLYDNQDIMKSMAQYGFNWAVEKFTKGIAASRIYEIINELMPD